MDKLYHIYQEEVHPELLPPIILQTLGEKRDRLYNEYHKNVLEPAIQNWTVERDLLLEKYARMAGFENYEQAQNSRWDRTRPKAANCRDAKYGRCDVGERQCRDASQ